MSEAPLVLEVPDLAGDGWQLRAWHPHDAASLCLAWDDPAIIETSTPPPDRSVEAAARWIRGCEERRLAGVALDVVIAAPNGTVLGEIGFSQLDAGRRAAVVGWWVHAEARGRGLASAAVGALVDWAVGRGRLDHVLAEIGQANTASEAVARSAGFTVLRPASTAVPGVWRYSRPDGGQEL